MQINRTGGSGKKMFTGERQCSTSWIISRNVMTVVLFGAAFAGEDKLSEVSCFTPHPASASQFRIAPGSHPRLYHQVNVPAEKTGILR